MSIDYRDFEIEVGEGTEQAYPISVKAPTGEVKATLHLPYSPLELENQLLKVENALLGSSGVLRRALPTEAQQVVQAFGMQLFALLLSDNVRSLYDASLQAVRQEDRGLRLKLRIQTPDLAALPWELLYDERIDEYVCLSRHTPVIRYLDLAQPLQPLAVKPPLQILGMIASPIDLVPLDVAEEKRRMERALQPLEQQGLVKLTWLAGQTWRDLQEAMVGGPWHIFHFIGHSGFIPHRAEGVMILADEEGRSASFSAGEFGRLLADHHALRLIFLNSCEGARSTATQTNSSIAAALVRRNLPAVLAMQYPITDGAAIQFAETFYRSLAQSLPVDSAVAEARKAIGFNHAGSMEWVTPVLYMRANDGRIFAVDEPLPLPLPSPLPLPVPLPKSKWLTPRAYQISGSILVLFLVIYMILRGGTGLVGSSATPSPAQETESTEGITSTSTFEPTSTVDGGGITSTATLTPTPIPTTPDDTATYIHIPAGELQMGTTATVFSALVNRCMDPDGPIGWEEVKCERRYSVELPDHPVQVQEFWIMDKEVSNAQYRRCVDAQFCKREPGHRNLFWKTPNGANYPVNAVDWDQAREYAKWVGGALPTEVEWEMACRGTDGRLYPWEKIDLETDEVDLRKYANYAWLGTPAADLVIVNSSEPSFNQLYNMAGNVAEWTRTIMTDYKAQLTESGRAVVQIDNENGDPGSQPVVIRGGSLAQGVLDIRCTSRVGDNPKSQIGGIGFRVVLHHKP